MNWPNFNAAPRIRPKVDTSRLIFASLMNMLPLASVPPVVRFKDSEAAPQLNDAAKAADQYDALCEIGEEKTTLTAVVEQATYTG